MLHGLRQRASALKAETYALYLACRDPRTPWVARLMAAIVVAYALSPLDLIPDVIPIFGYLDDIVLVPLGIALVIRLLPSVVLQEARAQAALHPMRLSKDWRSGGVIMLAWLVTAIIVTRFALEALGLR